MKMGIHKNTLGYTRMPIKIGIQSARLAEIHQLQDENGHREGRSKQSRPDASIQAFNLSHNQRTQRDPQLHLPICILPICIIPGEGMHASFAGGGTSAVSAARKSKEVPHMHYVTFPTCILALYLQTVRGTRCNTARSSIHIIYICRPAKDSA